MTSPLPTASNITDEHGHYDAVWIPSGTGYFTVLAKWNGNTTHYGSNGTTTLSSLVYQNTYVFSVESNSTISSLAFNTVNWTLAFTATGPNHTCGYTKITVAKSLVANASNLRVYFDGNQTDFSIASMVDSWLLMFNYVHSTHRVAVDLDVSIIPEFSAAPVIPCILAISTIVLLLTIKKKKGMVNGWSILWSRR